MALNPALVAFVKKGLQRGLSRDAIAEVLLRAGWPAEQVTGAMTAYADLDFPIPVPRPVVNVSSRDAFLYVVMFATLILSGFTLGDLLFDLIEHAFPDPAMAYGGYRAPLLQAIRWSLATLIVAVPALAAMHSMT
jgi:hypothetical protein